MVKDEEKEDDDSASAVECFLFRLTLRTDEVSSADTLLLSSLLLLEDVVFIFISTFADCVRLR
jgi:hypothetical protein